MDSLKSQMKDAHLQIEGLEDGIQRHQQQQQAANRKTAAAQQELIQKWEEWNDLKIGLVWDPGSAPLVEKGELGKRELRIVALIPD